MSVAEAGSSSSRAKPPTRLSRDGSTLLADFSQSVTCYPTRAQKEKLLDTLRALPGNEDFTYQKLSSWFTRHRKPSRDSNGLDEEAILFPKLNATQRWQLRSLYRKRPEPTDAIITFWAIRLAVEESEVVAWIRYQQEKAKEEEACATTPDSPDIPLRELAGERASESVSPTFPRPHLPTPAESPSISPQTRMPSLPPIAVKVEEPRQCLSPVSSLGTPSFLFNPRQPDPTDTPSVLEGLPPLLRHRHQQEHRPLPISTSVPTQDPNTTFVASVRNGLRPDASPSEPSPRTVDEFATRFLEVEKMIDSFLHKYDSGQLEKLGWDASLSKPFVS